MELTVLLRRGPRDDGDLAILISGHSHHHRRSLRFGIVRVEEWPPQPIDSPDIRLVRLARSHRLHWGFGQLAPRPRACLTGSRAYRPAPSTRGLTSSIELPLRRKPQRRPGILGCRDLLVRARSPRARVLDTRCERPPPTCDDAAAGRNLPVSAEPRTLRGGLGKHPVAEIPERFRCHLRSVMCDTASV